MLLVGIDAGDDVLLHLPPVLVGHHVERKRQDVCRHRIVAVEDAVRIEPVSRCRRSALLHREVSLVETGPYESALLLVCLCLGFVSQQTGELRHQTQGLVVIGRHDETLVSLTGRVVAVDELRSFGRHAPVSELVLAQQAFLIDVFLLHVSHPLHHHGIAVGNGTDVPVLFVEHVADDGQCHGPRDVVGVIVIVGRGHVGQAAVFTLRVADVLHPLGIEQVVAEEVALAPGGHRAVSQPGLPFVALRTVDGHALVVGGDAPPGVAENLVEQRIGALEGARVLHLVVNQLGGEVFQTGLLVAGHLDVAETV